MSSPAVVPGKKSPPVVPIVIVLLALAAIGGGLFYLNRPAAAPVEQPASPEAKAYLANLNLSDPVIQASENMLNQRVVEVLGKITNKGPRELKSIDVFCLFYSVDGHLIYRERQRIVGGVGAPGSLKSGESKSFRLPFENLPEGWNQAIPKFVIAQIVFANQR